MVYCRVVLCFIVWLLYTLFRSSRDGDKSDGGIDADIEFVLGLLNHLMQLLAVVLLLEVVVVLVLTAVLVRDCCFDLCCCCCFLYRC